MLIILQYLRVAKVPESPWLKILDIILNWTRKRRDFIIQEYPFVVTDRDLLALKLAALLQLQILYFSSFSSQYLDHYFSIVH